MNLDVHCSKMVSGDDTLGIEVDSPVASCCLADSVVDHVRMAVEGSFAFSFVEGVLVKAIREGGWVLLDEINLASAETLQRLSGLLEVSPCTVS